MNKTVFLAFVLSALVAACVDSKTGGSEDGPQDPPADTTFTQYPGPVDTTVTPDPGPVDTTVTPDPGPFDTTVTPGPVDTTVTPDPGPVEPPVVVEQWDTIRIRIMDYNVGRFSKVLTATTCAPMVGKMIDEIKPDAVMLQELDSVRVIDGSPGRFQLKYLASNTPGSWNYFFGSNLKYGAGGTYGIGVMWNAKHKALKTFHTRLNKFDGAEVRGLCTVEFEHFVIMSTHLDHKSAEARQQQMLQVNSLAKEWYGNSDKIVILAGDFNGNQSGGVLINAKQAWTRVSSDEFSSPAKNPKNTIDHIFVLNNKAVGNYKVVPGSAHSLTKFACGVDVTQTSDHLPIKVELEYRYKK